MTSDGPINRSYQRQLNGNDIPGATDPALVLSDFKDRDIGAYWVAIWSGSAFVRSEVARVDFGITAQPVLSIARRSGNGTVALRVEQGSATQNVEYSDDLNTWHRLHDGAVGSGAQAFTDSSVETLSQRFYRVR